MIFIFQIPLQFDDTHVTSVTAKQEQHRRHGLHVGKTQARERYAYPMVVMNEVVNESSENRSNKQDLPTPVAHTTHMNDVRPPGQQ